MVLCLTCLTYGNVDVYWRARYVDCVLTSPCVCMFMCSLCVLLEFIRPNDSEKSGVRNENLIRKFDPDNG
jgi:hypothetical protein